MDRRHFMKGLAAFAGVPLCGCGAFQARPAHWSYEGHEGPEYWGGLDTANLACSAGSQQSPIDLAGATKSTMPALAIRWQAGGTMVNNGHTIQVNVPKGSTLTRGDVVYDLLQYHFHAPSEHLVDGKPFAMEAHFVHKRRDSDSLGVLGVFLTPADAGAEAATASKIDPKSRTSKAGKPAPVVPNAAFAALAAHFPAAQGQSVVVEVDPMGLLPTALGYFSYEGSLTTPPCSEIVEWMVLKDPIAVAAADIARFTALYPMNARPVAKLNGRELLVSASP